MLDGTISLEGAPGFVRLALRPGADGRAASLDVTLPGTDSVGVHVGLERLDVARRAEVAATTWTVGGRRHDVVQRTP